MKETLVDFYSKKYYEAEVKFRELKLDLEKKELLLSEAQDRISKLEQTPALSIVMSALLNAEFEEITRPVLKFLCENYHPHVSVIITPTTAVLYEGELSIGEINDYVVD